MLSINYQDQARKVNKGTLPNHDARYQINLVTQIEEFIPLLINTGNKFPFLVIWEQDEPATLLYFNTFT